MKSYIACFIFILSSFFSNAQTAVDTYGQLSVNGVNVVDQNGNPTQLQGMSLFWSQWEGARYYNHETIEWLRDDWCVNIIRAAMGVNTAGTGYLFNQQAEEAKVRAVVEAAIELGIYVIIDWHTYNIDAAPGTRAAAIDFFSRMARDYGHYPNIIYEPYNEPLNVSWSNHIKPYLEDVIEAIREHDPNNIIVCGTPNWSQDVDAAAADPITGQDNIAYTLHYYAGSHGQALRNKGNTAISAGLCLMVTEYGVVNANGDGGVSAGESNLWYDWLDQHKISFCGWSITNKAEGSAAIQPQVSALSGWTPNQLTASGNFMRNHLVANCPTYESTAPNITVQPQHRMVEEGSSTTFNVVATGGGLSFQWQKNGVDIPNATSSSLTISNVSSTDVAAYRVIVTNDLGTATSTVAQLTLLQPGPWNGVPHTIPGIIQAEQFDVGGQNETFYDTTPNENQGGAFRNDGVDIATNTDAGKGSGYNIGWVEQNEWVNYTVNILHEGEYDFHFRVASAIGGATFRVELNGDIVVPSVTTPNTGNWLSYQTVSVTGIPLPSGEHIMRLHFEGSGVNVNYIEVTGDFTDCNGDNGGTAYLDECGVCVAGNTGLEACLQDCNGDYGGDAFLDECGTCVGGNSDNEPCVQDCSGDWGGTAYLDDCENCVGGNTGLEACVVDCNNTSGGTAYIDDCDVCVGGTTGIEPNAQCPPEIIVDLENNRTVDLGTALTLMVEVDEVHETTYQWYFNDELIPDATSNSYTIDNVRLSQAGTYYVIASNQYGNTTSNVLTLQVEEVPGPWNGVPHMIPGVIPAEEFDLGGQGVAFWDSNPDDNAGGAFRNDGVDIEENINQSGVYHIGWTNDGEWVNYTVHIIASGTYNFNFNVASEFEGRIFSVQLDENELIPEVSVPNTGSWHSYETVSSEGILLTEGEYILRVSFHDEGINLESIEVIADFDIEVDCNGDINGTAFIDECGICVSGNTGVVACEQDCNGDWGGDAHIDSCDMCTGGQTGIEPINDPADCILLVTDDLYTSEWKVFPNPANDKIYIELPENQGEIMLYNNTGQLLKRTTVDKLQLSISVENIPAGIYQLVWINKGQYHSMKISVF